MMIRRTSTLKNLKKPTYNQKQRIAKAGIDPTTVLVKSDSGISIVVITKDTDKVFEVCGKTYKEIGEG